MTDYPMERENPAENEVPETDFIQKETADKENNVILAVLKLSRAMRRCAPPPPPPVKPDAKEPGPIPCPPAIGRLMACIAENRNISSRDLCEILDLRPSSLSEMLARAESDGLIIRTADEKDRRMQRIQLSPKGQEMFDEMEAGRKKDLDRKTACFTEEEKKQFCALCDKLCRHLETLVPEAPERHPHPGPGRPPRRPLPPEGIMRC